MKRLFVATLLVHIGVLHAQSLERDSPSCDTELQEQARHGAEAGEAQQIYLMARYLSTGKCIAGDGKRAIQLYLEAAKLRYPPAYYNLGLIAAANQDFASAEGYFFEGASLGHRGCELQLGILYSIVPPPVGDDRKAYAWLLLTESRKEDVSGEAAELLKKVRTRLTEQQRTQAETLSAKLRADFGSISAFAP